METDPSAPPGVNRTVISTIIGTLGLVAMAVAGALLASIGKNTGTRADGGRYLGTALVAAPYLLSVMITYVTALVRGGFATAWPTEHPVSRNVLAIGVALLAASVAVAAVGILPERDEPAAEI